MALKCSVKNCPQKKPARFWYEEKNVRYLLCHDDLEILKGVAPDISYHKIEYPEHIEMELEKKYTGKDS